MPPSMNKTICFDVLGTCFDFTLAITALQTHLGPHLSRANVDPKTLFFSWFYAAQRDFTYASLANSYVPIAEVLKLTLRRACLVVDIDLSPLSSEEWEAALEGIVNAVKGLEARPDLKKCFDGLTESGWDVYGVTNGGKETSLKYFEKADINLDAEHLLSCDEIGIAKPDLRVYENAVRVLEERWGGKEGEEERWFVAAHAWDLTAARRVGFKTAYLRFEEHDAVEGVFGKFDLYAEGMRELLEKLSGV